MGKWTSKQIQDEIVARYLAGESSVALSRSMGIAINTVLRAVQRAGIDPRTTSASRPRAKQKLMPQMRAAVCEAYQAGEPLSQIAARYSVVIQTIRRILIEEGVPRRNRGAVFRRVPESTQDLIAMRWKDGQSQEAIGRAFGLTQHNVSMILRSRGVTVEKRHAKKSRHGNWKGGVLQMRGYVAHRVEADDPLFVMANSGGYVFEHRLVMARAIGRPLHHWETVHHIDGDKLNNDVSNLQLRIGRHGKGEVYECAICGSRNIRPVALD